MAVDVPKFDEFSSKDAWKQVRNNPKITIYFKDYSEKAIPNRSYMYNVNIIFEA